MPYMAVRDMDSKELGERVMLLREQKQWSQRTLARRAEVPRAMVSALEKGLYDPELSKLRRLAHVLGIRVGELVDPDTHLTICQALRHIHAAIEAHETVCGLAPGLDAKPLREPPM